VILLDTHVVVWSVVDPHRLSRTAVAALRRGAAEDGLALAAISLWEMASLFARGRVRSFGTVEASMRLVLETVRVTVRPISTEIAALAAQFPENYPRDPADRLIGATARAEGMALITQDAKIRACPLLHTIW
jgi:PIN domain nuclease of toxin-antitoxin system